MTDGNYPHLPAEGRADTSSEAAGVMSSVSGRIQALALGKIAAAGGRGLTSHELAVALGMERTTVQPRTTELKLLGKIRDSGQRRENPNGKRAIVWVATEATAV